MNREKRDKIPSMQVSFIDAICTQLYEVKGSFTIYQISKCIALSGNLYFKEPVLEY